MKPTIVWSKQELEECSVADNCGTLTNRTGGWFVASRDWQIAPEANGHREYYNKKTGETVRLVCEYLDE